jgi:dihydroxy-acid dehydratase
VGGPIALVQDGDAIILDIPGRTLEVGVSDDVLDERRRSWQPVSHPYTTGALAKYTRLVTSAAQGAVTS